MWKIIILATCMHHSFEGELEFSLLQGEEVINSCARDVLISRHICCASGWILLFFFVVVVMNAQTVGIKS